METASLITPFHASLPSDAQAEACRIMASGQIAAGPRVEEFETAIAALAGRDHLVAVSDMTAALVLALHLSGVGPGDEVLTLAFSCMSSNSAVARVGAQVRWVDLDPKTATLSLDDLEAAVTPRTKALMVYHVAGYPAMMAGISDFCRSRGIVLIEDCNAALGAVDEQGRQVGTTGDFAVYSFYPNRLVNALEGAALACPNAEAAGYARRLRRYGVDPTTFRARNGEIDPRSDIPEVGWSASLSQLHAAVGLTTLRTATPRLARIRELAQALHDACADASGFRPVRPLGAAAPAYWVFLLLAEDRESLKNHLAGLGIQTTRLHQRNDVYSGFHAEPRALPGTDLLMRQILALPCGWWVTHEDQARLTAALASAG